MLVVPAASGGRLDTGEEPEKYTEQGVKRDVHDLLTLLDVALGAPGLEPPHVVLEPHGEGGGEVSHGAQAPGALLHHGRGHHVHLGREGSGMGWSCEGCYTQLCRTV